MSATPRAAGEPIGSRPAEPDAFVVLDLFHRRMLEVMASLEALVAMLERDGESSETRSLAREVAAFMSDGARRHHEDEERHVFPGLLERGDEALVQAVRRLQQDHGWLEEDWMELEPHVQAIATGYGTCDLDTLRNGVPILAGLLRDHIALEESLVYPQARRQLSAADRREMGREMAARRRAERAAARG